ELPVYRDMRPGSSGDDVLQLEQALVRLGLMSSADERWDNATGAGVQALYARAGYIANATSKTDQDALKAARDQVRAANEALQDAIRALNESGGASGSGLIEAQNAVADAQAAVAVANADRVAAVGAATGTLTVAQATRDSVVGDLASTPEEIAAAEAAVVDAQNTLVATQTAQDALVAAA